MLPDQRGAERGGTELDLGEVQTLVRDGVDVAAGFWRRVRKEGRVGWRFEGPLPGGDVFGDWNIGRRIVRAVERR